MMRSIGGALALAALLVTSSASAEVKPGVGELRALAIGGNADAPFDPGSVHAADDRGVGSCLVDGRADVSPGTSCAIVAR